MASERISGYGSDDLPLDMQQLESIIAKMILSLFEEGGFDQISSALTAALKDSHPEVSIALHLAFKLHLFEIKSSRTAKERIRALGHIAAVADKDREEIRLALSPSMSGGTTPCPACIGSGVTLTGPGEPLFPTTFRDLKTGKNRIAGQAE